jgi:hypothetical protein
MEIGSRINRAGDPGKKIFELTRSKKRGMNSFSSSLDPNLGGKQGQLNSGGGAAAGTSAQRLDLLLARLRLGSSRLWTNATHVRFSWVIGEELFFLSHRDDPGRKEHKLQQRRETEKKNVSS